MGIGKFFGLSSSSNSNPNPPRPQGLPLSPGDSKSDHYYETSSSKSSFKKSSLQSYIPDVPPPPPYEHDDRARDSKSPASPGTYPYAVYRPEQIRTSKNSNGEDPLLELKHFDLALILDDSLSMVIADNPGGRSRWDQAWDAVEMLVDRGLEYDKDGIDIHFLNRRDKDQPIKDLAGVRNLRAEVQGPAKDSYTPTGDVLDTLLLEYRKETGNKPGRKGVKRKIFLVVTDGDATDSPTEPIAAAAKFFQDNHFPANQLGIQFIQVGNDPGAAALLDTLDRGEDLGLARDIVDTMRSNGKDLHGDVLIKALVGAINRKLDKDGEPKEKK